MHCRGLNEMRIAMFVTFLIVLLLPATAFAMTAYGHQEMNNWAASDRCVAAAHKTYPDYTAESNAKRDQAIQQCLAANGLPPHTDLDHH